jgi:fatty-acyl-CoA synthase
VAEIFYTSGTSARPKGVMLTHRNVYLHALQVCMAFQVENSATELHTIPLFHANGWGVAQFLTMMGGKHVMVHTFDPKEIFRLIEVERVNHFSADPIMATVLVNHPERKNYDLSSLRRIIIGGAASSPTLVREVEEKLGCECFSAYGLTETSPALSLSQMKPGLNWEGEERYFGQAMTGYAMPGVELKIVDADDQDLPQNGVASGELVVRADGVMKGYWNQPDTTAEVFRGGWFHTGDVATINQNGYVIPVPDQKWGEVPKALVVLREGASVTESQLIEFCRSQLARYKCPHTVDVVESLPKTGTGKVLKKNLRKQYERAPSPSPATAPN